LSCLAGADLSSLQSDAEELCFFADSVSFGLLLGCDALQCGLAFRDLLGCRLDGFVFGIKLETARSGVFGFGNLVEGV